MLGEEFGNSFPVRMSLREDLCARVNLLVKEVRKRKPYERKTSKKLLECPSTKYSHVYVSVLDNVLGNLNYGGHKSFKDGRGRIVEKGESGTWDGGGEGKVLRLRQCGHSSFLSGHQRQEERSVEVEEGEGILSDVV